MVPTISSLTPAQQGHPFVLQQLSFNIGVASASFVCMYVFNNCFQSHLFVHRSSAVLHSLLPWVLWVNLAVTNYQHGCGEYLSSHRLGM